jgi:salicylate hydroxylase
MPVEHAAIIGAGIAGLTAALSFARHGIRADVFEQADRLTDVGAGLQISPNASRILEQLGVLDSLSSQWLEPREIRLLSGVSLRLVASVPCGDFARTRWGAPYGALHRATLQKALLDAVSGNPLCTLHLGSRIAGPTTASLGAIMGEIPQLIVGADGVWSKTRAIVAGSPSPRFSGSIAWRFTVPEAAAPAVLDRDCVTALMGPAAHLVCYPIGEAGLVNMVAIGPGPGLSHDWNGASSGLQRDLLRKYFSGWNVAISSMLEREQAPTVWPLFEVGNGPWHNGRDTVLIGDAAHAMTPFAAQGAAMAIEDGFELAGMVASKSVEDALDAYEKRRQPRIARLRQRAAFNRFAYHARGPFRLGRDFVLSLRPSQSLAADLDWIYGYRAIG